MSNNGFVERASALRTNAFASIMGTLALGLAWRLAAATWPIPTLPGEMLLAGAALLFLALTASQALRVAHAPKSFAAEWNEPIASSFFGTFPICLSLLAMAALPYWLTGALALWVGGAVLQLTILIQLMARWITAPTEQASITPPWLIPMVGNGAVCFAGSALGYADVCWGFLATALITWIGFLPLFLQRLIAGKPELPPALAPTLSIFVSAPAINALAWFAVTGMIDNTYRVLAFTAFFFALLALRMARHMVGTTGFAMSWWAFTFPAAALASTFVRLHQQSPSPTTSLLAWGTLLGATGIVATVWIKALGAVVIRPPQAA
jgi:tellurite resistance protein